MALTVGLYVAPAVARPVAVAAVVVAVGVTAHPVLPALFRAPADVRLTGVLTAAGLLFFAFAGYARIATLGEEVRDPERTIPRAVPVALGIVLVVYAVVAVTALAVLGAPRLAAAPAPLAAVVQASGVPGLAGLVRLGAAVAVTGVGIPRSHDHGNFSAL
jgi:APA family basic amino acid/polyamine antiporter